MDFNKVLSDAVNWVQTSSLPTVEKFLLICLIRNGLRISDICNLDNWKIINEFESFIISQKNNEPRTIAHNEAHSYALSLKNANALQYHNRNRFYYYRLIKNLLPDFSESRKMNHAATHAARYIRAQQVYSETNDINLTKKAIGNRSAAATEHYLTASQRVLRNKKGILASPSGSSELLTITKNGVIRIRKQ